MACGRALRSLDSRLMARQKDVFIDHLQQVPLFSACSRKDLQLVAKRAEEKKAKAVKAKAEKARKPAEAAKPADAPKE